MPINSFLYPSKHVPAPYEVANSLRFNDGSSDYLTRSQTNGNQDKWTWSVWLKRSTLGSSQCFFASTDGSATSFDAKFDSSNRIRVYNYFGGGFDADLVTTRVFRDVSAWYHIVVVYDSGNSTEAHRLRIYVNGTEESSFSTTDYPGLNADSDLNVSGSDIEIGRQANGSQFFDGYMAEVVLIDGQALAADQFGEFDEDSPTIWKPKDVSGLTFGTNGFYLDFEDSSALGNDVSGNNNDFTAANLTAIDQSIDTCTNNFATINPLTPATATISEGNLKFANSATNHKGVVGTFGASSGKWYCEIKTTDVSESTHVGIIDIDQQSDTPGNTTGYSSRGYSLSHERDVYNNNGIISGYTDWSGTYGDGDILGIAMDLDNDKLYFSKGGQWSNGSGAWDSTTFNASTGAIPITAGYTYTFGASVYNGNNEFNFGSPPFSISSGNADANGFGNFEYAVPSGFFSLCTKNLAENG